MADPTKPTIDYSYTGFQQEQQDNPFPGTQLDNDLANLKRGIDGTIDALTSVRRSDGAVQNNSIGFDQLKAELDGFGFNPPTEWATETNYIARDTVFEGAGFYQALLSHRSGVFDDDLAAGSWVLVADFTAATSEAAGYAEDAAGSAEDAAGAATAAISAWMDAETTEAGRTLLAGADAAAQRASLELKTVATSGSYDDLSDKPNAFPLTLTALKALDTTTITSAFLMEAGREGLFIWRTGDYAARVALDPNEAVYAKADAIAATLGAWVRVLGPAMSVPVTWGGALGDDANDDGAVGQALVALCSYLGFELWYPGGKTYRFATTIYPAEGMRVRVDGAINIVSTTVSAFVMQNDNTHLHIDGSVTGPGATATQTGVQWLGTSAVAATAPVYVENGAVTGIGKISGFYQGIETQFAKNVQIDIKLIQNCRHSHVIAYCSEDVVVRGSVLDGIIGVVFGTSPSQEINGYNFTATTASGTSDYVRYPRSKRCGTIGCVIKNNPTWHGWDTHAGDGCFSKGDIFWNCRSAGVITGTGLTSPGRGAIDCTISGFKMYNYLDGTNTQATPNTLQQAEAIWILGPSDTYAVNCVVRDGSIYNHGTPASGASGAILVLNAKGGGIFNVTSTDAYSNAVYCAGNNIDFTTKDVVAINPRSPGSGSGGTDNPCGFQCAGDGNEVLFEGCVTRRTDTSVDTHVALIGIALPNTADKSIRIKGCDFSECPTPYFTSNYTGISGEWEETFTMALTGFGSPPSGSAKARLAEGRVTLTIPALSDTSNTTDMTATGMPALFAPTATRNAYGVALIDNNLSTFGVASVATTGVISWFKNAGADALTASSTKGVFAQEIAWNL
ncbi:hypothetical protein OEG84_11520 [Hoeflea sp. G2-23]|uniref:Pectate lyase superfamily protein domain-containing protein n=1 Tax=Hoeflea algicola TaxID=2983763 RepID=A0ABT3Z9A3_9HYPH|nr:hypothetical protein [Hoeflea algicola]MCY0148322.1 hypothetical protein [Hoeflea algicola]